MSVDDMLWWLYDTYKLVVGTRTIRRVFERKGDAGNRFKKSRQSEAHVDLAQSIQQGIHDLEASVPTHLGEPYTSSYAPLASNMTPQSNDRFERQLVQALQQTVYPPPPPPPTAPLPLQTSNVESDLATGDMEDEEMLELELQQIALQKRELEVKLRMKRLQQGRSPGTPSSVRKSESATSSPALSSLYKPLVAAEPAPPKRDSRSKKKIEESKKRTAERQERMLRDLERRSRRREHLTAEWVNSKDIWPLRAQAALADLMHQFGCYGWSVNTVGTFEEIFRHLYALVDHSKGDWNAEVHDDLLRERMKRKMAQLRSKMQKTGEIIGRGGDTFSTGWQRAENFTGPQAGDMVDDSELDLPSHDPLQTSTGGLGGQPTASHEELQYEPVPDPIQHQQIGQSHLPYGNAPLLHHTGTPQYPILSTHHGNLMPYGQLPPQQGLGHDGMNM